MSRGETWPDEWPHVLVARGMADVAREAAAGARGVVLLSPPGAAAWGGVGWWRALAEDAQARFPGMILADVLDCADGSALALAAIRMGQKALILDASAPGYSRIATIAAASGVKLLCARPPTRDSGAALR